MAESVLKSLEPTLMAARKKETPDAKSPHLHNLSPSSANSKHELASFILLAESMSVGKMVPLDFVDKPPVDAVHRREQ